MSEEEQTPLEHVMSYTSQVVLFILILGFAATIDYKTFVHSLKSPGVVIVMSIQMIIMPLVGYGMTQIVDLPDVAVVVFILILASPGGALSNFFNSVFNGDLAMSVAMTTVSTVAALPLMPLNLILYLQVLSENSGNQNLSEKLDWGILGRTVGILLGGVVAGLYVNHKLPRLIHPFYRLANICGILQIVFAFITSNSGSPIWEKPPEIFAVTFAAALVSILLAMIVTYFSGLEKPQRFAAVVEVCIQNSAVAVSFAYASFAGDDLSNALAVPVSYGVASTLFCMIFSIWAFNAGWTYTPENATLWESLVGFHQPSYEERVDGFSRKDIAVDEATDANAIVREEGRPKTELESVAEDELKVEKST